MCWNRSVCKNLQPYKYIRYNIQYCTKKCALFKSYEEEEMVGGGGEGEGGGEGRGGYSETFPIDFAFLSAGEGKLIFSYSPTGCLFFKINLS
jgi:hypothetical protein